MPGIYQLACGSCDYIIRGIMSVTAVMMEDGSEQVCPHPRERMIAEKATGRSWTELAQADRLIYRYALVCLACGKMYYYASRDLAVDAHAGGHIWRIAHQPSRSEAAACPCKA